MKVHVTIHDVSPAWTDEIDRAIDLCHAHGVKPALLVVPNFHRRAPLLDDEGYCERLRDLQRSGHEIVLHGFFHSAEPNDVSDASDPIRGLSPRRLTARVDRFVSQRVVSGGEAEFASITRDEAQRRLDDGLDVLHRAGLSTTSFVAPAWAMRSWMLPILAQRGFCFTEDHTSIYDPHAAKRRTSVVLNYASRSAGRLASTVAYNRLAKHARAVFPARIAIHPADMNFRLLRHEVAHLLAWGQGRFAASAADLFV